MKTKGTFQLIDEIGIIESILYELLLKVLVHIKFSRNDIVNIFLVH